MSKYRLLFTLLLLPTLVFSDEIPNYTVTTVYEAPTNAALGQLVIKNDTLYVVSRDNSTLLKVNPDGTGQVFAGGAGSPSLLIPFTLPDEPLVASEVSMGVLTNVAIDPNGNLYVQIARNTFKITPGGQLTLFAGTKAFTSPVAPISGLDGPAVDAVIPQPGGQGGAAIDSNGNVFLRASTSQPQIVKVDTGGTVTLYAGTGDRGNTGDGGSALSAQLYGLGEIAADAAGNLYLAEAEHGVRKIATDGTISTILGSSSTQILTNSIVDNVSALETNFGDILYLAVGPDGSVFFVTSGGSTVYQLSTDGHVSTIAGNGLEGFEGDGGPARSASFHFIHGLTVDPQGNVYVADRNNRRIRKLTRDTPLATGGDSGSGSTGETSNQDSTSTGDGMAGGGQDTTSTGNGTMTGGATDSTTTGGDMTGSPTDTTSTGDTTGLPTGTRGPIALDLDTTAGDQMLLQTAENPKAGDNVIVDIIVTAGASGQAGFQTKLTFDPAQLEFSSVAAQDVFAGGVAINTPGTGSIDINIALLGVTASKDAGSMAQATFKVLDGFTGQTNITLESGQLGSSGAVEIGSGGSFVVIGGVVSSIPTDPIERTDFDGDGTIGFTDFLNFAGAFGKKTGEDGYDARIDLDDNGEIGFTDFLAFASRFGQKVGG